MLWTGRGGIVSKGVLGSCAGYSSRAAMVTLALQTVGRQRRVVVDLESTMRPTDSVMFECSERANLRGEHVLWRQQISVASWLCAAALVLTVADIAFSELVGEGKIFVRFTNLRDDDA